MTAMPAVYAEEAEENEGDEAEDTVVTITGSRIRRDEFASPSPIQIVSVDEAKESGITNVADMIQRISLVNGLQIDNTINTNSGLSNASEAPPAGGVGSVNVGLRGLGAERTLILINGRRLGASGVRGAPSQPDLSMIPIDMVERAEVLSDSASAVYGADAVAGVINIIMKDNFDGAQVSVNLSQPSDPGGEVTQISFVTGGESDRFKFVLGGEYYNRERISLGDRTNCIQQREIIRDPSLAEDGNQYNFCDNGFPDDAMILGDGSWLFYEPGATGDWVNPNNGQNVGDWTGPGNLAADTWSAMFPFLPSEQVGFDRFRLNPAYSDVQERLNSDLVQPSTRFSIITNASYMPEWGEEDNVELFFESSYFHRHLLNIATAEQIYVSVPDSLPVQVGTDSLGNPIFDTDANGEWITAANPWNPFGIEALPVVTIDGFTQDRDLSLDHFRFVTGIRGDLPGEWAKENGWSYELAASYDRGDGIVTQPQLDSRNFEKAQNGQYIDLDGNIQCGGRTNTPNNLGGIIKDKDCTPLNILASGVYGKDGVSTGSLTAEEYAFLLGERVNGTTVTQAIFSGYTTGDLFEFDDGGTASIVLGFESRRDHIESQADFNGEKGFFIAESPTTEGRTEGSRTIDEVFTEVSLPILAGVDGVHELTADLALRYTDESNFGSEATERVRVLYAPTDWLSFSVAYGTSFRAPNLREQFLGDQTSGVGGGADPCHASFGGGLDGGVYFPDQDTRSQTVLDNCALSGVDPTVLGTQGTTTIPVVISGNVDTLSPETSEQTTFTVKADVYEGDNASFNFAATYFDIDIENTISQVGAAYIMRRCYEDAPGLSSPFCSLVGPRNPNLPDPVNLITTVNDSFVNIGQETSAGFDINTRFSYTFEDFMDDTLEFIWTTQLTIQDDRTRTIIPEEGTDDLLGTHGTPELRFVHRMAFNYGDFSVIYSGRWIDETDFFTRNPQDSRCYTPGPSTYLYSFANRPQYILDCVAESKYYSDLALTWTPDDTFRATFGISNVTDEGPALVNSGRGNDRGGRMTGAGYDQVGRALFLQATFKF